MKDKDGQELVVGDMVMYIANDSAGHGALFEGRVIAVKENLAVVETPEGGAYVAKYSPRIAFLEGPDDDGDGN